MLVLYQASRCQKAHISVFFLISLAILAISKVNKSYGRSLRQNSWSYVVLILITKCWFLSYFSLKNKLSEKILYTGELHDSNIFFEIGRMVAVLEILYLFLLGYGASASMTSAITGHSDCMGSLNIAHEDELRNLNYLTLEGFRTSYPNLRRGFPVIRRNVISHLEVLGSCCWELYPERMFKGEKQFVFPGGSKIFPDFQPVSIKKMECWCREKLINY